MAKRIPFKVSARTARLIGRENVSNFDGAIIELIKNGYDAGAKTCVLYFNNKYDTVPDYLDNEEIEELKKDPRIAGLINDSYIYNNGTYQLSGHLSKEMYLQIARELHKKMELYIVDNGSGMTLDTIEKYWMTIGTNNKEINYIGSDGRIKAGAKGIGRFALDRLGNFCTMLTTTADDNKTVRWNVEWNQFEQQDANIDDVYADIEELDKHSFETLVKKVLSFNPELCKKFDFSKGTIFRISGLRDIWNEYSVNSVYTNLETLIPPTETDLFSVYLYSSLEPNKYGEIRSYVCDDFDYKLHVSVEDDQVVLTTVRNEFSFVSLDKDLFKYDEMNSFPFDMATVEKGSFTRTKKISEIMPNHPSEMLISEIGPFDFTLYFLKRTLANNEDKEVFKYREIPSNRGKWLDKFGGIKLYRDYFRVRPYGETGSNAFDWLELGERADRSPGGPTQSGGGKLRPNQVVGVIKISRLTNINFEDKSSREGLQENKVFVLFKHFILALIGLLESDRSTIMTNLKKLHNEKNKLSEKKNQGTRLANTIIKNKKDTKKDSSNASSGAIQLQFSDGKDKEEKELLADTVKIIQEEKEQLQNELQLMRTLASTGIVITSFAHELQNLSEKISRRTKDFITVLDPLINKELLVGLDDSKDPYVLIEDVRNQDEKLKYWLDFALNSIRRDKRTLRKQNIYAIFEEVKKTWSTILDSKKVEYSFPKSSNQLVLRIFQIDVDTIFNNLITNSLYAFNRRDASGYKKVEINVLQQGRKLVITYEDSGPGLVNDISDPNEIFKPFFTTKTDLMGKEIGTGLGMWLVKSVVDYYSGDVKVERARPGFKLVITIPLKSDEGVVNGEV